MAAAQLPELQRQDRNGWDPGQPPAQQHQAAWPNGGDQALWEHAGNIMAGWWFGT
jgi:hypothetical protein